MSLSLIEVQTKYINIYIKKCDPILVETSYHGPAILVYRVTKLKGVKQKGLGSANNHVGQCRKYSTYENNTYLAIKAPKATKVANMQIAFRCLSVFGIWY